MLTLRSHNGNEYPDPLTSCPGYRAPSGPPIYLLAGPGFTSTRVSAHSFKQGSTNLDHCVFDSNTYTNSDAIAQSAGRGVLHARDVVVLMPKTPLAPGLAYTVALTVNDVTSTWTFTAGCVSRARSVIRTGPRRATERRCPMDGRETRRPATFDRSPGENSLID